MLQRWVWVMVTCWRGLIKPLAANPLQMQRTLSHCSSQRTQQGAWNSAPAASRGPGTLPEPPPSSLVWAGTAGRPLGPVWCSHLNTISKPRKLSPMRCFCRNYVLAVLESEEEQGLLGDAKESSSLKTQLVRACASFGASVSLPWKQDFVMGVGSYLMIASWVSKHPQLRELHVTPSDFTLLSQWFSASLNSPPSLLLCSTGELESSFPVSSCVILG